MAHGRRISRVKFIVPEKEVADKYLSIWNPKDMHFNPGEFPKITGLNFFKKDLPVNLEIGCGTGEYLIDLAAKNPEQLFIGIDSSKRTVLYAVDLANKTGIDNIHFIFGNFNRMLDYLSPSSLDIVYFHFPDPNYGTKNEKKKILTEDFLDHIHSAFIENGYMSIVTDQYELKEEFLEVINSTKHYEKMHQDEYLTTFEPDTKSRFQRSYDKL